MNKMRKKINVAARPALIRYTAATVFVAIFGIVYESFSHEVYSPFMYLAFLVPLVLGILPYLLIMLTGTRKPFPLSALLIAFGTAVLTVGSIMQGVLEIYGTTNRLMAIYLFAGMAIYALGMMSFLTVLILREIAARK